MYGRGEGEPSVIVALNFHDAAQRVRIPVPAADGVWREFLFNLAFTSRDREMHFHGADDVVHDRILIPGSYAHIYCREKVWTDAEWVSLLAVDRT